VLVNPTAKMHQLALQRLREAGELLGLQFVVVEASEPDQFATAFEQAHRQGAEVYLRVIAQGELVPYELTRDSL
jgi:hypothetical protein